jgi:hypothetical protein
MAALVSRVLHGTVREKAGVSSLSPLASGPNQRYLPPVHWNPLEQRFRLLNDLKVNPSALGASILIQNLVPMRMIDSKTNLLQQYLPVAETGDCPSFDHLSGRSDYLLLIS